MMGDPYTCYITGPMPWQMGPSGVSGVFGGYRMILFWVMMCGGINHVNELNWRVII